MVETRGKRVILGKRAREQPATIKNLKDVSTIAALGNGNLLVVGRYDGSISFFKSVRWNELKVPCRKIHDSAVGAITTLENNIFVSVGWDSTIVSFDATPALQSRHLPNIPSQKGSLLLDPQQKVQLSAVAKLDGDRIIVGSRCGKLCVVRITITDDKDHHLEAENVTPIDARTDKITQISVCVPSLRILKMQKPEAIPTLIATASADFSVKLWTIDGNTLKRIAKLTHQSPAFSIAASQKHLMLAFAKTPTKTFWYSSSDEFKHSSIPLLAVENCHRVKFVKDDTFVACDRNGFISFISTRKSTTALAKISVNRGVQDVALLANGHIAYHSVFDDSCILLKPTDDVVDIVEGLLVQPKGESFFAAEDLFKRRM